MPLMQPHTNIAHTSYAIVMFLSLLLTLAASFHLCLHLSRCAQHLARLETSEQVQDVTHCTSGQTSNAAIGAHPLLHC